MLLMIKFNILGSNIIGVINVHNNIRYTCTIFKIVVKCFYNVFIKNLPEDTLLTIYECKK